MSRARTPISRRLRLFNLQSAKPPTDQMDQSMSSVKLDESNISISSMLDSSRISLDGFLANIPGSYQLQQKKKKRQLNQSLQSKGHTCPPSSLSTTSRSRSNLTDAELNLQFQELAETVQVKLSAELAKHIHTLLRLGVPSDEVYHFLRDCMNRAKKTGKSGSKESQDKC